MRKWTPKDYKTMPWKNGGGSTTELAIFPERAGIDQFIWRLSTATVAQDGPFSHFAQIDRSLAILSGAGMVLQADADASHGITLTQTSMPHRFTGEEPIYVKLISDTVVDLNLMTRRDVCQHYMQRLLGGDHEIREEQANQVLLFCERGQARIRHGMDLEAGDLILIDEEKAQAGVHFHLQTSEDSIVYLMRINFLSEV